MAGIEEYLNTNLFSGFINYGYYFIWFAIGGVILGFILYFVLVSMRFKHRVRVLEVVGDAIQEYNDRGALLKDKETKKAFQLRLLKGKCILPPPPADSYIFDKKGKKVLYVAKISPTDYIYARPSVNLTKREIELTPVPQDQLFWMVNMIEKDGEKYSKQVQWWQNPYILGLGTMAICLIILILTFKYSSTWHDTAHSTALSLMEAGKGYTGQVVS